MAFRGSPTTLKAANESSQNKLRTTGLTPAGRRRRNIKGPYKGKNLQKQIDRTAGF